MAVTDLNREIGVFPELGKAVLSIEEKSFVVKPGKAALQPYMFEQFSIAPAKSLRGLPLPDGSDTRLIQRVLENERDQTDTLFFFLVSLDTAVDRKLRREAAAYAESLLAKTHVLKFAHDAILSEPFKKTQSASLRIEFLGLPRYAKLIEEAIGSQYAIAIFWNAWSDLEKRIDPLLYPFILDSLRDVLLAQGIVASFVRSIRRGDLEEFQKASRGFKSGLHSQQGADFALHASDLLEQLEAILLANGGFKPFALPHLPERACQSRMPTPGQGVEHVKITMKELLEAGIHFGHQTKRWNPKMKEYIFGERNGIYIIDLQKTLRLFEEASKFVAELSANDKTILFVGTKRQAQDAIAEEAGRAGMPYVNQRWLGGLLTNWVTVQKSVKRLQELDEMAVDGRYDLLTKKEVIRLERERVHLRANLAGIRDMKRLPDALFVIDSNNEAIAIREARKLGITVVAVVDTNCDPSLVDYVIPGNDDALRAIRLFVSKIADSVIEGAQVAGGTELAYPAEEYFPEEDSFGDEEIEDELPRRGNARAEIAEDHSWHRGYE